MDETICVPHNVASKASKFIIQIYFSNSLPSTNVQFDSRFGFASSSLPNVASLSRSRSRSSARSSSLPSCFSTSASSNQSSNAHGPHVPCDPSNASTSGALGFAKLTTLGATSSIELQGTLGIAKFVSFCSSSNKGVYSTQGPTSREPTKKKNKDAKIKKVFKEEWATQFPWAKTMVDLTSKIQMVHCKVCSLVEGKDKILNHELGGLQKHARKKKTLISHLGVLCGEPYINNDS